MDKWYGIVYKATNKVNGRMYIGQTVKSLHKRIIEHICNALNKKDDMYFHKAIRKYSKGSFIWEIIIQCNSKEELDKVEIAMIEKYNTFGNGYNLNVGGEGNAGFEHTEETRQRMSKAKKGENNPNYGKHRTEETRKKISEANEGKTRSEEVKRRKSESMKGEKNHNYGKPRTEEIKKKIGDANRGEKCYNYGKRGKESPTAKKFIVTTPEGEEIFVHGITEFCRNYKKEKLNHGHLISIAQRKRRHHKGYKCRYFGEEPYLYDECNDKHVLAKKYIIITPEGEEIFVHGIKDFCRHYKKEKLSCTCLIDVARKRRRHHKKYKCRYWEEKVNVL